MKPKSLFFNAFINIVMIFNGFKLKIKHFPEYPPQVFRFPRQLTNKVQRFHWVGHLNCLSFRPSKCLLVKVWTGKIHIFIIHVTTIDRKLGFLSWQLGCWNPYIW